MNCPKGARLIPLTQGKYAIVDEEDYESVSRFKWHVAKHPRQNYAACVMYMGIIKGKSQTCSMSLHRLIMRPPSNKHIDHIDHNALDCRKFNMRLCNRTQNNRNLRSHLGSSSDHKGVYWAKHAKKWRACICVDRKRYWLGYFDSEVEAAQVYDQAAIKYYGQFAYLNFPKEAYINEVAIA